MSEGVDNSLVEFRESKLDDVLMAIQAFIMRTNRIQEFFTNLNKSKKSGTSPTMSSSSTQGFPLTDPTMLSTQKETPSAQYSHIFKIKE